MTSNVGARDITKGKALGFEQPDGQGLFERMSEKVKDEINRVFNPEFLNRLDDVIVFHPLSREHISAIVDIIFRQLEERLVDEGFTLVRTKAATEFLVDQGYDEHYGARPLKRAIQRYIEDPLSDKILIGEFATGSELEVDVDPDGDGLVFRALSSSAA